MSHSAPAECYGRREREVGVREVRERRGGCGERGRGAEVKKKE